MHLFSSQQYFGGALVLYALRQKVGDTTFQKIERAWVSRYAGEVRLDRGLHRPRLEGLRQAPRAVPA